LAEGIEPEFLGLPAFLLDEVAFDFVAHIRHGFDLCIFAGFDHEDIIGAIKGHNRADLTGLERKCHTGEIIGERVAFDPPPVAAHFLRGRVLGIHLRHPVKVRTLQQLLSNLLRHLTLVGTGQNIPHLPLANHNHPQFDLLGRCEICFVFVVVTLNLRRRNHEVIGHLRLTHGLDNNFFAFNFFEPCECVALRLQGADKCRAVPAEFLADDGLNAVIHPIALDGALVSIRRFGANPLVAETLVANRSITKEMLAKLGCDVYAVNDEPTGIFTLLFQNFGIVLPDWMGGPSLALFSIMIVTVWKSIGYNTIIYLAGLQNIAKEYYEASAIDGASKSKQFFGITLPLISPTTYYVFMMTTIVTFQSFSQIYLMTGNPAGGPQGTTSLIVYYIYEAGFINLDFSYANAIALVLFVVILLLTLIQKRLEKHVTYE